MVRDRRWLGTDHQIADEVAMIETRRYSPYEIPMIVELLKAGLAETHYGKISYAPEKVIGMLKGNINNEDFFCNVITDHGQIIGGMAAEALSFPFSYEAYAIDRVTYVIPQHRSLKAITTLVTAYVKWAKERCVREIRWSQSSGYKVEKFAMLAKRFGFTQIGTNFCMEIEQ